MPKCLFDKCCDCIELRTGCLIIGYLNLIAATNGLITSVIMTVRTAFLFSNKAFRDQLLAEANRDAVIIMGLFTVILCIIMVAMFPMTIVFLVGIHQGKRGHVRAFMVYLVIFLLLCTIILCAGFDEKPINPLKICWLPFSILMNVYGFFVIRSYYYKMNDGSRQPAIYNTA